MGWRRATAIGMVLTAIAVVVPVAQTEARRGSDEGLNWYFIDSDSPRGPVPRAITAVDTTYAIADDGEFSVTLPFGIAFGALTVSGQQVAIAANGAVVYPSSADLPSGNVGLRHASAVTGLIAPWWDDWNPQTGGTISSAVRGTAPHRTWTIWWQGLHHFSAPTGSTVSFQVTFHEGAQVVDFHYLDTTAFPGISHGASGTVGIDEFDDAALQYSVNRPTLHAGLTIRYSLGLCDGRSTNGLGSFGRNVITGDAGEDTVFALDGADRVSLQGSADRACGGEGNDTLGGGTGADRLFGQQGNDQLSGGAGHDRLVGGPGHDRLVGGPGRDTCIGGPGIDIAVGCEIVLGIE